jgi:predicted RNA-binding protein with PIN domain
MSLQYIIDGYNLINHPLFLKKQLGVFLRIGRLTSSSKNKVTIIFDGYPLKWPVLEDNLPDIQVIYSLRLSADEKIKMLVEESGNRKNIVVVSDDKEIRYTVKAQGARIMGIEEFINSKQKSRSLKDKGLITPELSYSQMHKINQELRKIWLKP